MKHMNDDKCKKLTVISVITLGLISTATNTLADSSPKLEKCYGIVKKGMNACGANNHSCEGQNDKDGDPNEWIYVLEGTCNKIVGGNMKPANPQQAGGGTSGTGTSATGANTGSGNNEKGETKTGK